MFKYLLRQDKFMLDEKKNLHFYSGTAPERVNALLNKPV
jgi:hypothetical protein